MRTRPAAWQPAARPDGGDFRRARRDSDETASCRLRACAASLAGDATTSTVANGSVRRGVPVVRIGALHHRPFLRARPEMRVHLFRRQLEVEDVDILGDALRVRRIRDGDVHRLLDMPAKHDLRRRLSLGSRDFDDRRIVEKPRLAERA